MTKVSVIIPIYNVERYVGRCLDSVLGQVYSDLEIICVDDCGSDRSMEIVSEYVQKHPDRVRIITSDKNAGLGGARDKGMQHARGEYILFVDSDDYISDDDYIRKFVTVAEKENAEIVIGGYTREAGKRRMAFPGRNDDPLYSWFFVSACAKLYKRRFLIEHGLDFRGVRTYEDAPFWYRCLSFAPRRVIVEEAAYRYCLNRESITHKTSGDRTRLFVDFLEVLKECVSQIRFTGDEQEIFQYCLLSNVTANLLYNGRGCGKERMNILYREYDSFLKGMEGRPEKNRMIRLFSGRSEPVKNRMATCVAMWFRRLGLDRQLFLMVSRL